MTEEDTFKALKGLTHEEATALYWKSIKRFRDEGKLDIDNYAIEICGWLDAELNPYGWSVHKLADYRNKDFR